MAADNAKASESAATSAQADVLKINDVLSGLPSEGADMAGAYLIFQTIGGNTVISIDADGAGPAAPVAVLTLANVAGVTLQQLLNDLPSNG
jgi:hypothetical protein